MDQEERDHLLLQHKLDKIDENAARLGDQPWKDARKGKLTAATLEEVRELFGLLVWADFNAALLETRTPGVKWGFAEFDARFLRSLRDQTLGVGEEAKPLTRKQLSTLKSIMQRNHYATQIAVLQD